VLAAVAWLLSVVAVFHSRSQPPPGPGYVTALAQQHLITAVLVWGAAILFGASTMCAVRGMSGGRVRAIAALVLTTAWLATVAVVLAGRHY
jgi:hypothetical protein